MRLQHRALPGVDIGALSRQSRVFQVYDVAFASDGRCFGVATSHGLFLYSIDVEVSMTWGDEREISLRTSTICVFW